MEQFWQVLQRYRRSVWPIFPYGLGELYHLAIGQTLNYGRYFIERLRRLSLYLSQA